MTSQIFQSVCSQILPWAKKVKLAEVSAMQMAFPTPTSLKYRINDEEIFQLKLSLTVMISDADELS